MSDITFVERAKATLKNAVRKSELTWTPRALAVLEQAQKRVRKDGFDLVGTEHILFGIMSVKECLGARILENLGVTLSKCYQCYEKLCKPSEKKGVGKSRRSEDTDKVVQRAYEQAIQWGHTYIGAEHLLVGILLTGTGMGFQILTNLGITLEKVREETAKLIVCRSIAD